MPYFVFKEYLVHEIISVFSIVGLLAAFGFGPVLVQQAIGGSPDGARGRPNGAAGDPRPATARADVVGTKAVRRPLDTVGGTPAH